MSKDYITRIKANVSIFATKKTSSVLDGTYRSIFMGRSMNFEDLREYVPGDSLRDVDWKASSRNRNLLMVKRYVADKKHNILLVLDTGAKMGADTATGSLKKDVALYTAGTISYLAYKNGDNIGALYNSDGLMRLHSFKTGLVNVQRILAEADAEILKDSNVGKRKKNKRNDNSIGNTLNYIINHFQRKMIVFVITDMKGMDSVEEATIKRLTCRHDVLFVNVSDCKVADGKKSFDVDNECYIPSFVARNKRLSRLENARHAEITERGSRKLIKHGIPFETINSEDEIVEKIITLLEKHKHANIR